jgi:hypothetical protein
MHIVVVEAIAIYITEKKDVYIPIQSTSLPKATIVQLGPAQLNLQLPLSSRTCYELASSNGYTYSLFNLCGRELYPMG